MNSKAKSPMKMGVKTVSTCINKIKDISSSCFPRFSF